MTRTRWAGWMTMRDRHWCSWASVTTRTWLAQGKGMVIYFYPFVKWVYAPYLLYKPAIVFMVLSVVFRGSAWRGSQMCVRRFIQSLEFLNIMEICKPSFPDLENEWKIKIKGLEVFTWCNECLRNRLVKLHIAVDKFGVNFAKAKVYNCRISGTISTLPS